MPLYSFALAILLLTPFWNSGLAQNVGSVGLRLPEEYRNWLVHDVRWIITDQELSQFKRLNSDEDRDRFIVTFWAHRNPSPGGRSNAFKEEHYRRLAYADAHFGYTRVGQDAAGSDRTAMVSGARSDRGRVYILYGPPNKIDSYAAEANQSGQGGYAYEIWHYSFIEGIGEDATARFVDTCACGGYFRVVHPEEQHPIRK
jgi:GWxTD domain-containing protein